MHSPAVDLPPRLVPKSKRIPSSCTLAAALLSFLALSPVSRGSTAIWTGSNANANWSAAANWLGSVPGSISGTTDTSTASFSQTITGANGATNPVVVDTYRNIGSIAFAAPATSAFVVGSTSGNPLYLTAGGSIVNTTGTTQAVAAPIEFLGPACSLSVGGTTSILNFTGALGGTNSGAATVTLTGDGSNASGNLNGAISNGTASTIGFIVNAGVWNFGNSANSFTGGIALQSGTLGIAAGGALGSGTLAISGGLFQSTGGGAVTFSNNNAQTWSGSFGLTGGSSGMTTSTGAVVMGGSCAITVTNTVTVPGSVQDGGSGYGITKYGSGTLIFTGSDAYAGATTVNQGTLQIGNNTATAVALDAPVTMGTGATLTLNTTISGTVNNLTGGGTLTDSGTGVITVSQGPGFTGSIGAIGGSANTSLILAGSPTSNTTIGSTLNHSSQTVTFNGGTWVLDGGGAYSSPLVINSGTVQTEIGSGQDFYDLTALTVTGGYFNDQASYGLRMGNTFDANTSANSAFTGLQSGGLVSVVIGSFELGGSSGAYTSSYTLSSGTLSLANALNIGANAGGGGQTAFYLTGGKLISSSSINGSQGAGSKQAFVWNGGELAAATYVATNLVSGTGVAVSATTATLVNMGGILAPGDIGTAGKAVITGNYSTASSMATLAIDVGGTTQATGFQTGQYDFVSVSGTTSLGGVLAVSLIGSFVPANTGTFAILKSGTLGGAFLNVAFGNRVVTTGSQGSFVVSGTGNSVTLGSYLSLLAPAAPIISCSNTSASLSWTAPSNAPSGTAYIIGQSSTSGGPYTQVGAGVTGTTTTVGNLTAGVTYYFVVTGSYGGITTGASGETSITPLGITSAPAATGTNGSAFSYQIAVTGTATTFGASGLPAGLGVSPGTGLISGTPTAVGTSNVTVSASTSGLLATGTLVLTVQPAIPVISGSLSVSGTADSPFNYQITASNSPTSFGAMNLPIGLNVNAATGIISGTVTASVTTDAVISASNAGGTGSATLIISMQPAPPVITSTLAATGTYGYSFSYQITASNSPASFNATNLPSGLTVNTSTGVISGTPAITGTFNVPISAGNAGGSGTGTLVLTSLAPPR